MVNPGWIAALALALTPLPALATPQEELAQSEKELEEAQSRQKKLDAESSRLESELKSLQSQLVKLAGELQKAEASLSESDEKLRILGEEVTQKETALKNRQSHLSELVKAAISLSHTPAEAMVMMPGDVTSTMKAARALKMTTDSIKAETQELGLQLAELQQLKGKVAETRDAQAAQKAELDKQNTALAAKMQERQKLQQQTQAEAKKLQEHLRQLAKKNKDLHALLAALEQERKARQDKEAAEARKAKARDFADFKGKIRTPVSGKVIRRYGAQNGKNNTSKGIVVRTREEARVTAPFDGEVAFTGPFLKYGQIVILHHKGNFHTLLAGLEKIDVQTGQFLLEGEPIGAMGEDAEAQELYVEIRKDNQPVDPASWISAFKRP